MLYIQYYKMYSIITCWCIVLSNVMSQQLLSSTMVHQQTFDLCFWIYLFALSVFVYRLWLNRCPHIKNKERLWLMLHDTSCTHVRNPDTELTANSMMWRSLFTMYSLFGPVYAFNINFPKINAWFRQTTWNITLIIGTEAVSQGLQCGNEFLRT